MSVQNVMKVLMQACAQIRQELKFITNQKLREKLVLRHIETFAGTNVFVDDFRKGLEWFNVSEGLSFKKDLTGKIIILDFFTYCCINCMHILPDLDALEKKFSIKDGVIVIGVHSAKFSNERDSQKVLSAVQRYNIKHPVVNDIHFSMWKHLGVMCWPTIVMLGPKGQPLLVLMGEGHRDELILFTKVALEYFVSLKEISNHALPMMPSAHLLPTSKNCLLFPSKIHTFSSEEEKLVVSDTGNNRILIVDRYGNVENVIGRHSPGFREGNFENALFNAPQGVCSLDKSIYVADTENHAIRKIDIVKGIVSTVAGTGNQGYDFVGGKCGQDQELSSPWDVEIYHHDFDKRVVPVLLIAMAGTHQIWALFIEDTIWWKNKEYKAGTCAAIIGNGKEQNRNNSYPHAASLAQPSGLTIVQETKTVYFADSESSSIRQVDLKDGRVSAVCGAEKNPENLHDFGDVDGTGYSAKLQHPLGLTWHCINQEIYVADTYNHKIKKVNHKGHCKTLYGCGYPDKSFQFNEPSGLACSSTNNDILYVADTNNHAIKVINMKDRTVLSMPIVFSEKNGNNADNTYTFDTAISAAGGELTITFDVTFENDLKLNTEAPQKWSIASPTDTWKTKALSGPLSMPISITIGNDSTDKELHIYLDLITCKTNECIPKRLFIVYKIKISPDAPVHVAEHPQLDVK